MELDETMTPDEMITTLLKGQQTAIETIEELESEIGELKETAKNLLSLDEVGLDDVFIYQELPGIIRILRDLPPEVRDDPCRRHELDLLTAMLQKVDAAT